MMTAMIQQVLRLPSLRPYPGKVYVFPKIMQTPLTVLEPNDANTCIMEKQILHCCLQPYISTGVNKLIYVS